MVFLAGLLAERIGARRTLAWGAFGLLAGGLACTLAPVSEVMDAGLLIAASGTSMMAVAGFAFVGRAYHGTSERARAFGILGTAVPVVSLIAPFVCGWLVDVASWRAATLIWALLGAIALIAALLGLDTETRDANRDEYLTPLLAGMLLVSAVELINQLSTNGISTGAIIYSAVAVASLAGIVIARRRMQRMSLKLEPVKSRIPLLMLAAVAVGTLTYQWYVGFLAFQHLYGMSDIQIAVAMIPAQAISIIAARLISRVIVARGLRQTVVVGTLVAALSCLLFLIVDASRSVIILVVVMAIYAFLATAVGVAVSNAAMNALPSEHSGAMSAFRSAASAFGSAVTAVVMGALLIGTYDASLSAQSTSAGLDASTSISVSQSLNAGISTDDVSSQMALPQGEVTQISELSTLAMTDALHAKSLASAGFGLLAAALLAAAMRRRKGADYAT